MAYIRLPLGIKVALEYDWNGKVVVNIYHVITPDPITTIKLEDIATAFKTFFSAGLAGQVTSQISLFNITAMNLDEANGERISLPVVPVIPGLIGGDSVSNNVACVVSLRTAKTGRSFQGRNYVAGIPEQEVSQNDVSNLITGNLATSMLSLVSLLGTENAELVVASFKSGGVPRTVGIATPVDVIFINARVDTQRRRLPKS